MFDSLRIFAAILVGFVLVGSTRSEDKGFTIRAFSGSPFGVAELLPNDQTLKAPADSVRIDQLGAGALYPAKTDAGCRFLFDPTTTEVTFRGKAIPIIPEVAPSDIAWKNEQQEWWTSYRAQARAAQLVDTVPLQLDQYLMSMLARRLKLEKIDVHSQTYFADSAENRFFALLTGAESIRVALQKETLLQTGDQIQKATLRLPKPVLPPAVIIPEPRADVEVEPIAMMVHLNSFMRGWPAIRI